MLVFLKPFSCRLPCTREVWDSSVLGVLPLRFDGADDAHECALPAHSGTCLCQRADFQGSLTLKEAVCFVGLGSCGLICVGGVL